MRVASTSLLTLLLLGCAAGGLAPAADHSRPDSAHAQAPAPRPPDGGDEAFELTQTQEHLGVPVRDFPPPQGLSGFDELPATAPAFKFTLAERPPTGPKPGPYFEKRPRVEARAPDGSVVEAFVGYDDPKEIAPGHGFVSTHANTRQRHGAHHGYGFSPYDVFIGRREGGRLRPTLRFRDVGSHTTAPHHMAVDGGGNVHLAVADVNTYDDNRLDVYWAVGDPAAGRWTAAWRVDRRGFTSWSHPWSAAWGVKVHLLWTWCDVSVNKGAPGMGAFHLERAPGGFGRKTRVIRGELREWGAALDPQSGRLLVAFSKGDGVYVVSKAEGGGWTRAALLHPRVRARREVAVEAAGGGAFVVRLGGLTAREFVLRPL